LKLEAYFKARYYRLANNELANLVGSGLLHGGSAFTMDEQPLISLPAANRVAVGWHDPSAT
jgi:hypothetical protein